MSQTTLQQSVNQSLGRSIADIRGVGPALLKRLHQMGIFTVEEMLFTLPIRYEDRRELRTIGQLRIGEREVFQGTIVASNESVTGRGRRLYEVVVGDGSGRQAALRWFHYRLPWMRKTFAVGRRLFVIGEVKLFGAMKEVHHPDVEFVDPGDDPSASGLIGQILPVYPLTEGLTQKVARKLWQGVVDQYAASVRSAIPEEIARPLGLLPLADALRQIHRPDRESDLAALEDGRSPARRTLIFDEFFFLQLGLALKQRGVAQEIGLPFAVNHRYTKPLAALLPYRLTAAQRRVLGEIKNDLMEPHPMNRLVQGDVGSGKTIVALMAALLAIENGCQVAVVAPTEILAEQHYLEFHRWLEELGLKGALLTGSTSQKRRREILDQVAAGEIDLLVGTHAVLQDGVEFKRLGLGIIDEQHRFGVRQRGVLRHKGVESPHILVMTATPIPRTLSLTLYGDLSLSVIDELPPGRSPVKTRVVSERSRQRVYEAIECELAAGRQAYIVYPLVEESEKSDLQAADRSAERLQREIFPSYRVGLLHGRMKPEEKEGVMAAFKGREIDLLVATTVIEVGVDVPNATVMVIEHAERFGLAQLHQLRGRVGRGGAESQCWLVKSFPCGSDAEERLQVMAETNDGFRIAEVDLKMRGPGEFFGTRQAGLPDLRIADLLRDGRILEEARGAAFALARRDDFDSNERYGETRRALKMRWGKKLELASIG